MHRSSRPHVRLVALSLSAILFCLLSCAQPLASVDARGFRYFEHPDPYDTWSWKISRWQLSQMNQSDAPTPATDQDSLGSRYLHRRSELRQSLAREIASWIQEEAKLWYTPDTAVDHWPTLEEVLASDGEDCDGLELLVHQILLDLGFPAREVYRAVVHRASDDLYHMVTLWFEDPEDPWVIDPTGAMAQGMPRMSEIGGWVPLKLFSTTEEYTVRPGLRRH